MILFIIWNFLCKILKFFSNFILIFYFFSKLPTIIGYRITQVYSRQITPKIGIIHD